MNIVLDILGFVIVLCMAIGAVLLVWAGFLAIRREFFNTDGSLRDKQ